MRARYGMDRRNWAPLVIAGFTAVILAFVGWLTVAERSTRADGTLLSWDARDGHTTAVFEVRRAQGKETRCVLRAQDRSRIDVGYAIVDIPAGADSVQVTYELATLMQAFIVELLGCAIEADPRVNGPQFPPGVVPPEQPWQEPID
jgi:hypothetical protein